MANYSNQISTNARVARWMWSEYNEKTYSQGAWDIAQEKYKAVCLEAVDDKDYVALRQASYCETSTTYRSLTQKITEEEIALSLQMLVIDKLQPHNMIVSITFYMLM